MPIDSLVVDPSVFDPHVLTDIARGYGTPVWVYDTQTIRDRIALLHRFDVIRYAQKANANTHLLRLMRAAGVRVDAVSHGELVRSLAWLAPGGCAHAHRFRHRLCASGASMSSAYNSRPLAPEVLVEGTSHRSISPSTDHRCLDRTGNASVSTDPPLEHCVNREPRHPMCPPSGRYLFGMRAGLLLSVPGRAR